MPLKKIEDYHGNQTTRDRNHSPCSSQYNSPAKRTFSRWRWVQQLRDKRQNSTKESRGNYSYKDLLDDRLYFSDCPSYPDWDKACRNVPDKFGHTCTLHWLFFFLFNGAAFDLPDSGQVLWFGWKRHSLYYFRKIYYSFPIDRRLIRFGIECPLSIEQALSSNLINSRASEKYYSGN